MERVTRSCLLFLGVVLLGGCQTTAATAPSLNVMTFNIRYGTANDGDNAWSNRREMVARVIESHQPDVLGVQEALAFQLEYLTQALPGFQVVGVGRDDGVAAGEFSAILYRTERLELMSEETFWFSDTPDVPGSRSWGNNIPRICTHARFADRATGATFDVFNVHLDHQSQPSRLLSVELLREHVAVRGETPAIVTGDFNAGESSAEMIVARQGRSGMDDEPLLDTFRILRPDAADTGTFNGFTGERGGEKIDYILISHHWDVLDAAIVHDEETGRYPSDHFPVRARLQLR